MNKIINNFLFPRDKFLPELHSKQPGCTYSVCGPFTKHCERIQKFRETGNLKHLHRSELYNVYFAHNAAYFDSKDLAKTTISEKILKDRAHQIARNCKYDGYQKALASMIHRLFYKKTASAITENEQLAEELHKPVISEI